MPVRPSLALVLSFSGFARQPSVQLGHRVRNHQRLQARQALHRVRAVTDGHAGAAGVERHLQVVRGVANHQQALGRHIQFSHQLLQHQRMRFTCRLVRRARAVKHPAQCGALQRFVQAAPTFAGGYGQQMAACAQIVQ